MACLIRLLLLLLLVLGVLLSALYAQSPPSLGQIQAIRCVSVDGLSFEACGGGGGGGGDGKILDGTAAGQADVIGSAPAGTEQGLVTRNIPSGTQAVSGTFLTTADFNAAYGTAGTPDSQVLSIQGIASMTPVLITPTAGTSGGASTLKRTSAGSTEDEHEVKGTAGTLYSITATNTNASARYIRCANDTAANVTPGTTTPIIDLAIPGNPAGAGITFPFPVGAAFSVALTCWLVTGAADTDTTEVAANEIKVLYSFK